MKISVVTPSFNQARFIEDTIVSVRRQHYPQVQHIVMDGGSTDGTVEILRRYEHLQWVSKKDNGQAAAINEGFRMADGEIVAWLNSDDYYEDGVFRCVAEYFAGHPECSCVYGDLTYVDKMKNPLFVSKGKTMTLEALRRNPDGVRQPSCFWRREVLDNVGALDESFHVVMDYDFFLRAAKCYEFHYINKNFGYYRCYDENKSLSLVRQQERELYRIMSADTAWGYLRFYRFIAARRYGAFKQRIKKMITGGL